MTAPSPKALPPERSSGLPRHAPWLAAAWVVAVVLSPAPARDLLVALGLLGAYYAAVHRWSRPRDVRFGGGRALIHALLLELVVPAAFAVAVMSAVASDPLPGLPILERAERLVRAGLPERAETELKDWLERHPDDVRAHRARLWAHFRAPLTRGRGHHRDDATVLEHYRRWPEAHPEFAPVANLAQGIYWRELKEPARALEALDACADPRFPGISLERGRTLARLGRYPEAIDAFELAVRVGGDERAATHGLAASLTAALRWERLRALFASAGEVQLQGSAAWRALQLHDGEVAAYLLAVLAHGVEDVGATEAILALLTLALWFLAIRWWDRFEGEPMAVAAATVLLGAVTSQLVFVVNDVVSLGGPVALRNVWWKDLAYSVVVIGLVEEAVKLVPLLLVRRLTRHVDEPVDWAIYGACSALGFATWENVAYQAGFGSATVVARAITSVPLHVCLTALVGLSAVAAEQRGRSKIAGLLSGLAAAALVHGLFDFFILGPFQLLIVGTLAVAILLFRVFIAGLAQALALSPFRGEPGARTFSARRGFFRAFVALVIATYVLQARSIGPGLALLPMLSSTLLNGLGVLLLLSLAEVAVPAKPDAPWPERWLRAASK